MEKPIIIVLLAVIAVGVWVRQPVRQPHTYTIEKVKDGIGNDVFLRIDVEDGEECAVGHGWAVVRAGNSPTPYTVPFCNSLAVPVAK
jgi:hypothetical protein